MVRFITRKDIKAIQEIEKEAPFEISDILNEYDEEEEVAYALGVFDADKQLVGFCTVGGAEDFHNLDNYDQAILLSDTYILEEKRHNGYGKELVNAAIYYAYQEKKQIVLDLWNDEVIPFYKSFGFEPILTYSMFLDPTTKLIDMSARDNMTILYPDHKFYVTSETEEIDQDK